MVNKIQKAKIKIAADVVSIGTVTRDVFLGVPQIKILKDPEHLEKLGFITGEAVCFAFGAKLETGKPIFAIGGGAANSAITFSRQGLRASALITIGKDENGSAAVEHLRKEKVKVLEAYARNLSTAYSTILIAPNSERTILVYRGAANALREDQIKWREIKTKWAYIASSGIDIGLMKKIFSRLKNNNTLIAFNPSKLYLQIGIHALGQFLKNSAVVILNQDEASFITGIPYENEKEIFKKLDREIDGLVIMTKDRRGCIVSDGQSLYRAGIFKDQRSVDRTGAGDAFGGGFVSALIKSREKPPFSRETIIEAIRFGSANATSVIEQIGAQAGILTAEEYLANSRWRNFDVSVTKI